MYKRQEAVCAAGSVAYSIKTKYYNDALVIPASSAVQLETKALLVMRDSVNPLKIHTRNIPAPETDVFLATSGDGQNIVDIAHGDVLTFVNLFDGTGECTLSDGESVETGGIIRGRRTTRYSRRG